ncbi:hypothetical protein MGI18_14050 [Bacillus sp. OVS6]|nr:hypothetical protein MGI18_14050 [Bacillus sp. OVS6]
MPNVFEEAWQVSYYCKLKEKYLPQDLSLLLFDKDKIEWEIDGVTLFTDIDLHDKWITRGDSIFVEYSYSTEGEDNDE